MNNEITNDQIADVDTATDNHLADLKQEGDKIEWQILNQAATADGRSVDEVWPR